MDCQETREDPEYRRGFIYLCCDQCAVGSEGCTTGYHRAADGKRGKFDDEISKDTKANVKGNDDEGADEDEEDGEDDDEGDE